ncbi:hypothetical protein D1832_06550 [Dermacoccus abyssi]|uniref:Uncharacterized protein n=3 Tax=Dermacoccus TaxID=57495 RepID=A0A417Z765_9MICO|nr:hypothetical protein D1832_06550 [Dermacoccus abyssi]
MGDGVLRCGRAHGVQWGIGAGRVERGRGTVRHISNRFRKRIVLQDDQRTIEYVIEHEWPES